MLAISLLFACGSDVAISEVPQDADGDGYTDDVDCNDAQASVYPGAYEVCDGLDNDCDEQFDEDAEDAPTWYTDGDGDGYGPDSSAVTACEGESGQVQVGGDCDDTSARAYPGGSEVCDGLDNDCNGVVDDDDASDADTFYADGDGDGYGDAAQPTTACDAPSGYAAWSTDCDDGDAAVHPAAQEVCNGYDDDCDELVDSLDGDTEGTATWYPDGDGDGYGVPGATVEQCDQPSGYAYTDDDCDDSAATVNPGATEVCDADDVDEDCDGAADDADASVDTSTWSTWFDDADGDGYGDSTVTSGACDQPDGQVADASDCDDTDPSVSPGATEVCDAADVDEDCDGLADDDDGSATGQSTWQQDSDGDGYGDPDATGLFCDLASGYVSDAQDCDDSDAAIHPGASEVCDGADNDCDGLTDDDDDGVDASGFSTFHADDDGDGYGNSGATSDACDVPAGHVVDDTDCDDTDADVNPGATEVCDELDNDCDGLVDDDDSSLSTSSTTTFYADADADGYGDTSTSAEACVVMSGYVDNDADCDDADADVSPDASEVCDGVDNDCDGDDDEDFWSLDFDDAAPSELVFSGDAAQAWDGPDGYLALTTSSPTKQQGTAVFADRIPGDLWYVAFEVVMTDHTSGGAAGVGFGFLDQDDSALTFSAWGDGYGFKDRDGYVVELDTHQNSYDSSDNHVALMDADTWAELDVDASIPTLKDSLPHDVEVYFDSGDVEVWIDGTWYLNTTIKDWVSTDFLMGVGAGTGDFTSEHQVDDLVVGCF